MSPSRHREIVIRVLRPNDDRRGFTCGPPDLDRYFHEYAGQHSRRGFARVEVADLNGEIVGYSASAPGHITTGDLPADLARRLPRFPLPMLRLARLGVAQARQRCGMGGRLLRSVLRQAHDLRERQGCVGVVVDAKPEAADYYAAFGFRTLPVESGQIQGVAGFTIQLFLPVGTIEAAFGDQGNPEPPIPPPTGGGGGPATGGVP